MRTAGLEGGNVRHELSPVRDRSAVLKASVITQDFKLPTALPNSSCERGTSLYDEAGQLDILQEGAPKGSKTVA